ncbi:hypothetical protein HYT57_00925 [Candidatus Woesearchaeota archaeon]|nr:hypothetical protein [Candidatus Woesearchaeota archaeon]
MSQDYIMNAVYRRLQSLRGKHPTDVEFTQAVAEGVLEGRLIETREECPSLVPIVGINLLFPEEERIIIYAPTSFIDRLMASKEIPSGDFGPLV